MIRHRTPSQCLEMKIKAWNNFYVTDRRKTERRSFTVWSKEQLKRLLDEGIIDDVNYSCCVAVSAEMGYSYSISERKHRKQKEKDEFDEIVSQLDEVYGSEI